ncbi:hypothetical protein ElyMa_000043100 [Elysia marginata]|uniref:Uncharacterized protein n=1 Tax=Elysia marginata TaxID=1093978 RepID=A0AAV4ECX2_9GAST|nr:hypothetical protein ElyMa_000043100 [Elysia marginata]
MAETCALHTLSQSTLNTAAAAAVAVAVRYDTYTGTAAGRDSPGGAGAATGSTGGAAVLSLSWKGGTKSWAAPGTRL